MGLLIIHSDAPTKEGYLNCYGRIGLVKELKSAFVEETSTDTVTFRGTHIELNSLASIDQTELVQQIEKLRPKR